MKKFIEYLYCSNVLNENIWGQDQSAMKDISAAVIMINGNHPFFATLFADMPIEEDTFNATKTMATDGVRILYNAQFVRKLTIPEIMFVLVHEVMHCALEHFSRVKPDKELWNKAADYAINQMLDGMVGETPSKVLLDRERFNSLRAEIIYDMLEEEGKNKKNMKSGKSKPGGPGGSGDPGDGWDIGEVVPKGSLPGDVPVEKIDPQNIPGKWQDNVKKAIAQNREAGTGTGSFHDWIRGMKKAKVNWKAKLRQFLSQSFNKQKYRTPYRRFLHRGIKIPGPYKSQAISNVVIAIDTSGSVSDEELKQFQAEIKAILKPYDIKKIHVIQCDTAIKLHKEFTDVADIKLVKAISHIVGRGGTSFKPVFEWIRKKLKNNPSAVIYFTDGYPDSWPARPPWDRNLIWVISTDEKAPYGNVINLYKQSK